MVSEAEKVNEKVPAYEEFVVGVILKNLLVVFVLAFSAAYVPLLVAQEVTVAVAPPPLVKEPVVAAYEY